MKGARKNRVALCPSKETKIWMFPQALTLREKNIEQNNEMGIGTYGVSAFYIFL